MYPTFVPYKKFQDRRWRHVALLVATFVSTTLVGADHYVAYLSDFTRPAVAHHWITQLLGGLWYSCTVLLILGSHELGHYLACRYYQVDASLPFFIPMPFLPTGTFGAFIRIREQFPSKRALFDIGAAGPFAGFVIAVPALFIGIALSHVVKVPVKIEGLQLIELGEPLLFKAATWLTWGTIPEGYTLNLHPMAFAAWFGLLATALNLLPIGQLDGGHITYAVLGRRSSIVTIAAIVMVAALTLLSLSWVLWTLVLVTMTLTMGPHHPRPVDDYMPLNRPRLWLALAAALILIVCFTYAPAEEVPSDSARLSGSVRLQADQARSLSVRGVEEVFVTEVLAGAIVRNELIQPLDH